MPFPILWVWLCHARFAGSRLPFFFDSVLHSTNATIVQCDDYEMFLEFELFDYQQTDYCTVGFQTRRAAQTFEFHLSTMGGTFLPRRIVVVRKVGQRGDPSLFRLSLRRYNPSPPTYPYGHGWNQL